MEFFINELSIQEQYINIVSFEDAVIEFTKIVSKLNQAKCDSNFYKKGDFYYYKNAISGNDFRSSLGKIRDKFIKTSFQRIVFDKNNPQNWQNSQLHINTDAFFSKTLQINVTGQTLAEVTERKLRNSEDIFLILNFLNSTFTSNNTSIVKNESSQITIDCVDSNQQIEQWLQSNCIEEIVVKNISLFEKTSMHYKGAIIYIEKSTDRFWYLDTFHKTHYEVFDRAGGHLGEADLDGNLDRSKKDNSKRLDIK